MEGNVNEITSSNRVYQLRRQNFQKKLVVQLCYLGYLIILLEYVKYGCTIWTLILRTIVQSLLAAPFPNDTQIRRLSLRSETPGSNYFSRLSNAVPSNNGITTMPGAFFEGGRQENVTNQEDQIKEEVDDMKRKIRTVLFHASLTVNLLYILTSILFPVDFIGQLEGNYLREDGLTNTPSPFNNANGFIQGERKGGFFLQMIGESVPQSNLKGNLGIIMFEMAIILCQFGLFVLTCVNFADLGHQDRQVSPQSDGYDGKVLVTQIDPDRAIEIVLGTDSNDDDPGNWAPNMV
ncbi:hypothetical protein ZYGR_0I05210 [Zygosaccharomyces rouxii]|uniref:ZYRO0C12342p n=2 Tax=Zygosaccharomyces rouxii TaxID=4956 RepID=C5DTY6_ZYGRC|nr:uncharacterized protein ZYRO0C12342g [Zygosaccharomyces rouxii]KAH9201577.1 hypothetical protein LQ764DRAFT_81560 [Zygosaccharomyces rouxii]GAV48224.1 hypothetical protein ZYGR_0I05210 [Zygosaccharomyces rouxii]CAR27247.1 ZYRO0C12342p [Zygosaccharomyces rouxii]